MTKYLLSISLSTICLLSCSGNTGTGPENPTSISSATFAAIQQEVFTPTCAISGCHNGSERPNLTSAVAYNNIVNVQSAQGVDYIDPGNPDNSYLYRKIIGVNIAGRIMPRNGAAFAAAITDSVRTWIENGALE